MVGLAGRAFGNPSPCATADETNYLVTGALPAAGTVCQQGIDPFPAG